MEQVFFIIYLILINSNLILSLNWKLDLIISLLLPFEDNPL